MTLLINSEPHGDVIIETLGVLNDLHQQITRFVAEVVSFDEICVYDEVHGFTRPVLEAVLDAIAGSISKLENKKSLL